MAELLCGRRHEGLGETNRRMASQKDANGNLEAMEETKDPFSETGAPWDAKELRVPSGKFPQRLLVHSSYWGSNAGFIQWKTRKLGLCRHS